MKLLNKSIITILASMLSFSQIFAAWIDHFEVTFDPTTVKVWEALDLTIEAVDKNNETVLDYDWTILIFSESDPEAELPTALKDNTYNFLASDQWKVKFENSVKFKTTWVQNIYIYDLNDDTVFGLAEATVEKEEVVANIDISILSPETWLTIWTNSISISGNTQKNHQIKVIVNNDKEVKTTSNNDWVFEVEVSDLADWNNTFKAQVLDADMNVIWESNEVSIKVDLASLNIKNVKVTPETVDTENSYEIEVVTNPWLVNVSVIINDILTKLKETKDGVYNAKMVAPEEAWTYKIDVKVVDELWHEKTELWAASIVVNEVVLAAAEKKEEVVAEEEVVEETKDNKDNLKITWLKLVELKSKSILTWDKVEEAKSYNVYKKSQDGKLELIETVDTPRFEVEIKWDEIKYDYFAVKAVAENEEWETFEWDLSEATKVQTWPEMIILLLISLLIAWFLFSRRRA